MLVQFGFDTSLAAESFERRPLNLGVSGSMSRGKLRGVRTARNVLVGRLTGEDRLSIVAFDDDVELRLEPTVLDSEGREVARGAVAGLQTRDSTDIEAGLAEAFAQVAPYAGRRGWRTG